MIALVSSLACILLVSRTHASAIAPVHIEERAVAAPAACPTGDVLVNGAFYLYDGSVLPSSQSRI